MMKIFKYKVMRNDIGCFIECPKGIKIIRMNHVNDGFYKGDFVWGIVDPSHNNEVMQIDYVENDLDSVPRSPRLQLQVKEKQIVRIQGTPILAKDDDGLLYLYHYINPLEKLAGTGWAKLTNPVARQYKIVVYKTGQEIDEPIEELEYIGLCRLWIIQELGLYTFIHRKKELI
jgi:hypothetical protein